MQDLRSFGQVAGQRKVREAIKATSTPQEAVVWLAERGCNASLSTAYRFHPDFQEDGKKRRKNRHLQYDVFQVRAMLAETNLSRFDIQRRLGGIDIRRVDKLIKLSGVPYVGPRKVKRDIAVKLLRAGGLTLLAITEKAKLSMVSVCRIKAELRRNNEDIPTLHPANSPFKGR